MVFAIAAVLLLAQFFYVPSVQYFYRLRSNIVLVDIKR